MVHLFLQTKSKEKNARVENKKILSDDVEIVAAFKIYFDEVVRNLDANRNLECVREFKEDPVLTSIKKSAAHSSITNIRNRMYTINSNFF